MLARVIIEPLVHDFSVLPLRHRNLLNMAGLAAGRDKVARGFIEGDVVADTLKP